MRQTAVSPQLSTKKIVRGIQRAGLRSIWFQPSHLIEQGIPEDYYVRILGLRNSALGHDREQNSEPVSLLWVNASLQATRVNAEGCHFRPPRKPPLPLWLAGSRLGHLDAYRELSSDGPWVSSSMQK